jgi:hypothetical protein
MEHRIRASLGRLQAELQADLAGGGMKQGQDPGCATTDILVWLCRRVRLRLPRNTRMRHGLERAGLIFAPDGEPRLGSLRVGLLDQLFLAGASRSLTRTRPDLRFRSATPVAHQVRLFGFASV